MAKLKLTRGDVRKFSAEDVATRARVRALEKDPAYQRRSVEMAERFNRRLTKPQRAWVKKTREELHESRQREELEKVNPDYLQVIDEHWLVQFQVTEVAPNTPAIVGLTITGADVVAPKVGRQAGNARALTTSVLRQIDMRTPVAEYYRDAKRWLWFVHQMQEIAAAGRGKKRKSGRPPVHTIEWYARLAKAYQDLPPNVEKRTLAAEFGLSEVALRSAIRRCRRDLHLLPALPRRG